MPFMEFDYRFLTPGPLKDRGTWLSESQVAHRLGISVDTLRLRVQRGEVKVERGSRGQRFAVSEVERVTTLKTVGRSVGLAHDRIAALEARIAELEQSIPSRR